MSPLTLKRIGFFCFPTKEKEYYDWANSARKRKKSKRNEHSLDDASAFVVQGIATVTPIWRVTFFQFSSPEAAVGFWQVVETPRLA
jgi:hypothetical protein